MILLFLRNLLLINLIAYHVLSFRYYLRFNTYTRFKYRSKIGIFADLLFNQNKLQSDYFENDLLTTKGAMKGLVEESWKRITMILPEKVLKICEEEIRGVVISMLVLATVKRAAQYYSVTKCCRFIIS